MNRKSKEDNKKWLKGNNNLINHTQIYQFKIRENCNHHHMEMLDLML